MTDSNDRNHISESILIKYPQTGFKPVPMCENSVTPNASGLKIFQNSDSPNINVLEQQAPRPASSNTLSQSSLQLKAQPRKMIDTISISPKAGIKCYGVNYKFCNLRSDDIGKKTVEKITNLTKEEWLWTGESAYCICTHHVEQHWTVRDRNGSVRNIHCHGSEEQCNCELFRTRSIRLSHSNYDEIVTEGFEYV